MKQIVYMMLFVLIGIGSALAEGGKNQGETGSGETSTGSDAAGAADQERSGR